MIDENGFGNRLEMAMAEANYNNARLTKELNLSKNAIGNYKNNQIPNATILYELSHKLGTTVEYLLTGKKTNSLTEDENELLKYYRQLPEKEQIRELGRLEAKAEQFQDMEQEKLSSCRTG